MISIMFNELEIIRNLNKFERNQMIIDELNFIKKTNGFVSRKTMAMLAVKYVDLALEDCQTLINAFERIDKRNLINLAQIAKKTEFKWANACTYMFSSNIISDEIAQMIDYSNINVNIVYKDIPAIGKFACVDTIDDMMKFLKLTDQGENVYNMYNDVMSMYMYHCK